MQNATFMCVSVLFLVFQGAKTLVRHKMWKRVVVKSVTVFTSKITSTNTKKSRKGLIFSYRTAQVEEVIVTILHISSYTKWLIITSLFLPLQIFLTELNIVYICLASGCIFLRSYKFFDTV